MNQSKKLRNVAKWLRNGCDPLAAATELTIIAARVTHLEELLTELVDLEGPQPGTSAWAGKVRAALERQP